MHPDPKCVPRLSDQTVGIYDRIARVYDAERRKDLFERPWLERVLRHVPHGGDVLDLGCGTGEPIGAWLVAQGYAVTGTDAAPAMLDMFQERLPQAQTVLADMRALDLGRGFDAIVGWGSFFHLRPEEQRAGLPRIAQHLRPGGRLLLTVGPKAGEVTGVAGGETVYHASLSPEAYKVILDGCECEVEHFLPQEPSAAGFTLLIARRKKPDSVDK